MFAQLSLYYASLAGYNSLFIEYLHFVNNFNKNWITLISNTRQNISDLSRCMSLTIFFTYFIMSQVYFEKCFTHTVDRK